MEAGDLDRIETSVRGNDFTNKTGHFNMKDYTFLVIVQMKF